MILYLDPKFSNALHLHVAGERGMSVATEHLYSPRTCLVDSAVEAFARQN
jgi:hypothetical protein